MTHFIPGNQLTLLHNGEQYFPALERACDQAQHEIYLETYIFEDDVTGRRIGETLRRAAMRGVRVHLLIDGFGSRSLPRAVIDGMLAAGVRLLLFRPEVAPWKLRRHRLRRLHRKIVVVDQAIAFVGGINIIDDMDTPGQVPPRYDYAVAVEGPLVAEIHAAVRHLWSRVAWARLRPGWIRERGHSVPPPPKGRVRAAFLIRDTIRHRRDIEEAYLEAIDNARSEIVIANAYFLPGLNFRHALMEASRRGVRVILLLQGRVEYLLLHYASRALYGSFLESGIEIYEYHRSFMHAKVAVVDSYWATVGSSNIDPFSLLLSREGNVMVQDAGFAGQLRDSLMRGMNEGAQQLRRERWKKQPFRLRLASWLSYGLVRFLMGMASYVREDSRARPRHRT